MKRMVADGIEWIYRPNVVYTTQYKGWNINIRRTGGGCKLPWRLFVTKNNGGSISFHHQFWPTVEAAKAQGRSLVDAHESSN